MCMSQTRICLPRRDFWLRGRGLRGAARGAQGECEISARRARGEHKGSVRGRGGGQSYERHLGSVFLFMVWMLQKLKMMDCFNLRSQGKIDWKLKSGLKDLLPKLDIDGIIFLKSHHRLKGDST